MVATGDDILDLVRDFLAAALTGQEPPRVDGVERVTVGRSRENWVFDAVWPDGTVEPLIVRRDPLGGLLETSRADEFAVLRALHGSGVPVPRARWLDADGSWLGRPSLIMVREPGACDYFILNGERPLAERVDLARRLCDLLASLHTVDWRAAGLGTVLTDPGPDAPRAEVEGWLAVLRRDQLEPWPEMDLAASWLRSRAPRSQHTVVVHGDFKAGNVLLDGDRIVALLDWELAHLGDPMEDLGWITQPLRLREHLIPGAWEQEDLFRRYEAATGIEVHVDAVGWWNVLASFKTAVMQVSGLRSFVEGRSTEPYRPTAAVLAALLDAIAPHGPPTGGPPTGRPPGGPDGSAAPDEPDQWIDQHLAGARRLLEQVADEPGLSPAGAAMVADVRRLVRQVGTGWHRVAAFLDDDNQALVRLLVDLGVDVSAQHPTGHAGGRNQELRSALASVITELPDGPAGDHARTRIGAQLRRRLALDPLHARPGRPGADPEPRTPNSEKRTTRREPRR